MKEEERERKRTEIKKEKQKKEKNRKDTAYLHIIAIWIAEGICCANKSGCFFCINNSTSFNPSA